MQSYCASSSSLRLFCTLIYSLQPTYSRLLLFTQNRLSNPHLSQRAQKPMVTVACYYAPQYLPLTMGNPLFSSWLKCTPIFSAGRSSISPLTFKGRKQNSQHFSTPLRLLSNENDILMHNIFPAHHEHVGESHMQ